MNQNVRRSLRVDALDIRCSVEGSSTLGIRIVIRGSDGEELIALQS